MIVHDRCLLCVKKDGRFLRKKIKQRKIAEENDNKIKTQKKKWDFQQNIILAKSNHLGQFVNEQHKTKQNNCALDKKKTWNRTTPLSSFQIIYIK